MMAVHILPARDPGGTATLTTQLAAGRSAALFALMAGVSLALVTGRESPVRGRALSAARAGVAARAAVLAVVGLWLGSLESGVAVILCSYALLFVLALPFLGLRAPALLTLAGGVAVAVPLASHAVRARLPAPSYDVPEWASLQQPGRLLTELALTGYYPAVSWLAYALAGLGVGRMALRSPRTAAALVAAGTLLAAAGWAGSRLLLGPLGGRAALAEAGAGDSVAATRPLDAALEGSLHGVTPTTSWWWLAVDAPHSSTPPDLLHTTGTGLVVLGLLLLLLARPRWWLAPLVAAGSMVLSLYTLHVVLLATVLPATLPQAYLWHLLVAFAAALAWRRLVGRGPMEQVSAAAATLGRAALGPVRW